jgi:hypothetical protein
VSGGVSVLLLLFTATFRSTTANTANTANTSRECERVFHDERCAFVLCVLTVQSDGRSQETRSQRRNGCRHRMEAMLLLLQHRRQV